ncbi:choice-of-anchor X domain-containing protein [Aliikangiella maris]|uniref:Choice-of-anchor X domain-containing protein n=2 Tax=Aliikangiella maris TaxID=3162458 RepID=A0ABV2BTV9_9GAMM
MSAQRSLSDKLFNSVLLKTIIVFTISSLPIWADAASPAQSELYSKHIATPAKAMQAQRLSPPSELGIFSHSSVIPVYENDIQSVENGLTSQQGVIEKQIFVDNAKTASIVFLSPQVKAWDFTLQSPDNRVINSESHPSLVRFSENIQVGQQAFPGVELQLDNPAVGQWNVRFTAKASTKANQAGALIGYLMVKGDSGYQLYSYVDQQVLVKQAQANLVAYTVKTSSANVTVENFRAEKLQAPVLKQSVQHVTATITSPTKKVYQLSLNDKGVNGDKVAGDGQYSVELPTDEAGVYTSQVQLTGVRDDGLSFSRTTTDLYVVEKNTIELSNAAAQLLFLSEERGQIRLTTELKEAVDNVFLGAEIWVATEGGEQKPVTWIGGNVAVQQDEQGSFVQLSFDWRWLQRDYFKTNTTQIWLKNVRLQSIDSYVPLSVVEQIPLLMPASLAKQLASQTNIRLAGGTAQEVTQAMLMGSMPTKLQVSNAAVSKLVLVHGYCSGQVWNAGQFTNAVEFKDYKQNRSHSQFAQKLKDFTQGYDTFGVIAHSQGGAAALELYAKYWTGLDKSTNGRRIQSVGTPYQGTALAGMAAVLGELFGVGCGTNDNLTYNGASNWLSTIPNWARADVDYYTTSFNTRWWAYDYCHLATDLLLDDPEDGTTEKWAGQLSGAVNKGHKKGWCHTTGMRDTAQYKDSSRNSSMNSRAAR